MDAPISSSVATGLSGRYARALFALAIEGKSLGAVESSLSSLKQALAESADLASLVGSPVVGRGAAGAAIAGVADGLNIDGLTKNFLGVLAANRRLALLPAIIRDFAALNAARKGEVTADVVAAHHLTDAQSQALAAKLKAGIGRDVALNITVDPAILGGLVVRVGSRMIDSSLKTRLDMLGQALRT
ncbi:F0F1 ATP synthase subunit delta [Sandarakinorhabdus sp.]|uniref:F0F1 ATP synthase subunit delta n=1 Tax=Sandarakinorhabdus sp. TaxID=1916663 RepID=UPI003F70E807